jgi:glucuronate isomerase
MNQVSLISTLEEGLASIPILDAHTHIDASHLAARGLHDILLYHMVISDLSSAGCPNRARLSEQPDRAEAEQRLIEVLPYLPYIQNTSIFWGVRILLKDLYGWTEPINAQNWRRLDGLIRERTADPYWPVEMMRRSGVQRTCTELWRGRGGKADDLLQYSLEWAFFARAQWGVNDMALFELENAWNQPEPGASLPVTMGGQRPRLAKTIRSLDDVQAALDDYVARIPYGKVLSTAQHISTDINFRPVSDAEMAAAIARRAQATPLERDLYASYIQEAFLQRLEAHANQIVYQFSLGAEPLPFETGSKLKQDTIYHVAEMLSRHPRLRFQVFLSSEHANQALCTIARQLPNLSLAGYWWHNFFPGIICKVMSDRLDMLAANRQIGFFSDAYCVDWQYAKVILVRKQMARVLAEKVDQGQYTIDEALGIARQILFDSPQSLLGMQPMPATH